MDGHADRTVYNELAEKEIRDVHNEKNKTYACLMENTNNTT